MATRKKKPAPRKKRAYIQAARVMDAGIPCVHCGHKYDHKVRNTYPNGRRRRICGGCGKPFVTMREVD